MSKSKTSKASKAVKRKHVMREILEDDYRPPLPNQRIVKVLRCEANNLHRVQTVEGDEFLVSMPNKFRKFMWLRRNGYVVIEPIEEGDKVRGEIVKVVTKEHIKYYKMDNVWPSEFEDPYERQIGYDYDEDFLFENPNQRRYAGGGCESGDEDSDSESEGEGETEEEEEEEQSSRSHDQNESDIKKCVNGMVSLGAGAGAAGNDNKGEDRLKGEEN